MNLDIIITLAAFVFIGFSMITNKVPAAIACGISVVVLWFFGILDAQEAFGNFISDAILSTIGMMIITRGLMKTDILRNIATLVQRAKGGTVLLLFAVMLITSLMVSVIGSQITSVITVIPLAMALAEYAGIKPTLLVFPAVIGAQSTLLPIPLGSQAVGYLGTNQMLESMGAVGNMNMWDAKLVAFLPSVAAIIYILAGGWKLLPARELGKADILENGGIKNLTKSEFSKAKQYFIYFIFLAVLVLVIFSRNIGITAAQVTTAGAFLMVITGVLNDREFFGAIPWPLIFMMSFMMSFVAAFSNSGAGALLASLLQPIFGTQNLWIVCSVTFIFCIVVTQFMDNTALIQILFPIAVAACVANDIPAVPVVLAISSSAVISYLTPMASPSGLLAYQLGGYSIKEMFKFGVPVIAITAIVSCVWIPLYWTVFRM